MTRIAFVIFVFLIFPFLTLAAEVKNPYSMDTNYSIADRMLGADVLATDPGVTNLKHLSGSLTIEMKNDLLERYHKNAWIGFGLNFAFPGLGNWYLGDVGGALQFELGVLGSGLVLFGGVALSGSSIAGAKYGGSGWGVLGGTVLTLAGVTGILIFGVTGYTSPFRYADDYNQKLKKGLDLTYRFGPAPSFIYTIIAEPDHDDTMISIPLLSVYF